MGEGMVWEGVTWDESQKSYSLGRELFGAFLTFSGSVNIEHVPEILETGPEMQGLSSFFWPGLLSSLLHSYVTAEKSLPNVD